MSSTANVRQAWDLTDEQIGLIKTAIARDATDAELALFIQTCKRLRLDPFARQIFLVKRPDKRAPSGYAATTQVSIDGFRLVAERTREYRGQTAPEWCGPDGVWRDVWLSSTPPVAARIGVHRENFVEPLRRTALFRSYAQYSGRGNERYLNNMWRQYPELMLSKCAEALALRAAFPNDLSGIYTTDELPVDEEAVPALEAATRPVAAPAEPARPRPRLAASNGAPRTMEDFLAMGAPAREPVTTLPKAEPAPKQPTPERELEATLAASIDYDQDTGEVWPTPEPEPPKPAPRRIEFARPEGNPPVWSSGQFQGRSYLDTPRPHLKALLKSNWANTASSRQLQWAKYAIQERTKQARAEGRE
jgi:phage recombination protein Bet